MSSTAERVQYKGAGCAATCMLNDKTPTATGKWEVGCLQ